MRFCRRRSGALAARTRVRPDPALARGQVASTIGRLRRALPRRAPSHGPSPHARRLPLDAMEERRRAHDRDRRVIRPVPRSTRSCGGSASPTSSATARSRRSRASIARSCCSTGAGMRLRGGDRDVELTTPFVPRAFSGDEAIDCTLVAGPVRDFNAMFRRGRARGSVAVVRDGGAEFGPARFRLDLCRDAERRNARSRGLRRFGSKRVTRCSSTRPGGSDATADRDPAARPRTRSRSSSASIAHEALCRRCV